MAGESARRLILVDASGYLFRAFHATPMLTRDDGTPVNAVYGYCSMLLRLLEAVERDGIAVIFDSGRTSFRNEIFPEYKAHRPPPPEELIPQFPLVREASRAFGLATVEMANFEADDLIATYAAMARDEGWSVEIVSSDKDLMQMVGPGIRIRSPSNFALVGEEEVGEKFGVPPEKVPDVQALAGDSTDNVPGVPGIGVKIASELVNRFGDLEGVLEGAGSVTQPKRRERLLAHAEDARTSLQLVTLRRDVPVPEPLDAFESRRPDRETLTAFLREQGFRSLLGRVESLLDGPEAPPSKAPAERNYELVTTLDHLRRWVAEARAAGVVAVDTETTSLDVSAARLVGVSLAMVPGRACYIPLRHEEPGGEILLSPPPEQVPVEQALEELRSLLEDPGVLKVGQNLRYDTSVLEREAGIQVRPWDDTMLLSFVLDAGRHHHGLDTLSKEHLGVEPIPYGAVCGTGKKQIPFARVELEKACEYAAEDADLTLQLHGHLKPRLVKERLVSVYETIERPLVPVIAAMERAGVALDRPFLQSLAGDFGKRATDLEEHIHELAGHAFNVGSPKQLGVVLFEEHQFKSTRRTRKSGAQATSADVLEELAAQGHLLPARVLEWRQLTKLKGTYVDALLESSRATGRVHTSFHMAGAVTGRLSSNDPNLQNIPVRTEDGRRIRRAFVAPEGMVLVCADYSQIELRLLAEIANIPTLLEAFAEGADIHAMTAERIFGLPANPERRRRAKAINFGIIYGQSAFGLARQLGTSRKQADEYIRSYFEHYPGIQAYVDRSQDFARSRGYVETLFGRRCHIPRIRDRNFSLRGRAERLAINAPIQGTAADIIKRAMARMPQAMADAGLSARMLLQVHDELVFEAPESEAEPLAELAARVMREAAGPRHALGVPLEVEVGTGTNWEEAH